MLFAPTTCSEIQIVKLFNGVHHQARHKRHSLRQQETSENFLKKLFKAAQSICQKMFEAVSVEHGAIYIQMIFSMIMQQKIIGVPPMTMKSNVVPNSN